MAGIVEAGRPYRKQLDFAQATPFGLRFTHRSGRNLSPRDADLEPVLSWMRELAGVLEEISPAPAATSNTWNERPHA
jgi:hypothetical protein